MKKLGKHFTIKKWKFDSKTEEFVFRYELSFTRDTIKPLRFEERLKYKSLPKNFNIARHASTLEALAVISGVSYYKLYCPKTISTDFALSKEQADFWSTVYRKGLGEFCYRNNIPLARVARFSHKTRKHILETFEVTDKLLLGIGGGKDSLVADELLEGYKRDYFLLETQKEEHLVRMLMTHLSGKPVCLLRTIDSQLFQKHDDAYNGHIPISAIFAFTGLLTAEIFGYKAFMVANAASSNFGNIVYDKEEINHQWSKSLEFETMCQDYIRAYITRDIAYFSPIRQFYEIRIVELFAKSGKYFEDFTSCNRNFKVFKERPKSLWCGECPKCPFIFLLMAAFLKEEELLKIFKQNFFEKEDLHDTFRDLLGFGTLKPFDCVGPFEESQTALVMARVLHRDNKIFADFLPRITDIEAKKKIVFSTNVSKNLPTPFRFLGIKSVGILGYAKEGKVTEWYLKKFYPHLSIGILDKNIDSDYLSKQSEYDLIVKTPGIPKELVTVPYVTATNLFFANVENPIIGITGTKGKSTTASLIHHILKANKKPARLLGNIGAPMLEVLTGDKRNKKEIYVVELSSYMLDDIEYSPNVALLINLYNDHLTYHKTLENYHGAKANIFKFQKEGDVRITFPFKKNINLDMKKVPLRGKHNLSNIYAAVEVAKRFGISEQGIRSALYSFKPLPHRLEPVGTFKGVEFYDDANATTPEATVEAIGALGNVDTLFVGGQDRGYDFKALRALILKKKIRNIVAFPDTGEKIIKGLRGLNVLKTTSMEEAVKFAYMYTRKGKTCLLSCASPSYSIWKNFEEKGDLFKEWVKREGNK